jgi:site-specific DNA-methyltransferase (adenine-specific)
MNDAYVSPEYSVLLFQTDALSLLRKFGGDSVAFVVTDPPWNTGGVRKGTNGAAYNDDYSPEAYEALMVPIFKEALRVLEPEGTFAVWADYRSAPYLAVWGDRVWGRERRVGEIVVESLLGNPGKARWPIKHSTILLFAKNPERQRFLCSELPEVPRRPGGKVVREKAGKTYAYPDTKKVASVLSATLSNTDPQRVGYPDQKPAWVYELLIRAFTLPGATVVDPFAGSGTCGEACISAGRAGVIGDTSPQAIRTMVDRFAMIEVSP